uniref:Putative Anti-sigma-factor antagonist n=1 Tax=Magnetococcus massalia (strain MO-1) TaxID=451514 RepID=A0A1S7LL44_MAGMO|nr:putative Anti-sigma-factor antagonist [Candidatus Magnetococcus massalia]
MTIHVTEASNRVEIAINGQLGIEDQQVLVNVVHEHGQKRDYCIHLDQVPYLDSMGLGMLLVLREQLEHNEQLQLHNPTPQVMEQLAMMRFNDLFAIYNKGEAKDI